jgi:hypothetical protein
MRFTIRRFLLWAISWIDRTDPIKCTGESASWCPKCGDCTHDKRGTMPLVDIESMLDMTIDPDGALTYRRKDGKPWME